MKPKPSPKLELAPLTVSAEEIAAVNTMHARACDGATMKDATIAHVNEVRQIGLTLISMQERAKHGRWQMFFNGQSETQVSFSIQMARTYIRFAKRLKAPVTELPAAIRCVKDFMRWTGALAPLRGVGQKRVENPFAALMHGVQEITRTFRKWKDGSPVGEWPEHKRQQAMDQLRPVVDFYEELSALEARSV